MKNPRHNQRGQFVIEGVLLMVVMIGLFLSATRILREEAFLAKLVVGPWERVSGMIENGVWETPAASRDLHPNQLSRSNSHRPE